MAVNQFTIWIDHRIVIKGRSNLLQLIVDSENRSNNLSSV